MTNLTNEIKIHATVMRRVHTIHFLQSPVTTLALTAAIFVLALWGIGREVWVALPYFRTCTVTYRLGRRHSLLLSGISKYTLYSTSALHLYLLVPLCGLQQTSRV